MLENIITSKTRLRLLIKFFLNSTNKSYLNSLANEFDESTNSIRKELNNLYGAGYLIKNTVNNKVIYKVNTKHPLFNPIRDIIMSHLGIEQIVENVVKNIGNLNQVWITGDYARGIDSGTIEIVLVGSNFDLKYLEELSDKLCKKINRKIFFLTTGRKNINNGLLIYEN